MARFGAVHAFGYNSAESEPIWLKSEELAHCRRLALADVGRDPRSTNSWRVRQNFVFCQVHNARFHRFPIGKFTKFEHNTSIGVVMKTVRTEF